MAITLRAGAGRTELAASQTEVDAARLVSTSPDTLSEGAQFVVSPELAGLVSAVLQSVARGESVTVGALPEELSTSVAAEQLGISRPTLMKLIAQGELPAHKAGSHTRVRTADVVAFRRARVERQRMALEVLRQFEDDHGL